VRVCTGIVNPPVWCARGSDKLPWKLWWGRPSPQCPRGPLVVSHPPVPWRQSNGRARSPCQPTRLPWQQLCIWFVKVSCRGSRILRLWAGRPEHGRGQHPPPLLGACGGAHPHATSTWGARLQVGDQRLVAGPSAPRERARGGLPTGMRSSRWPIPEGPSSRSLSPGQRRRLQLLRRPGHRARGSETPGQAFLNILTPRGQHSPGTCRRCDT
jgi:hypothetical protein